MVSGSLVVLGDGRMGRAIGAGAGARGFRLLGVFGRRDRAGLAKALAEADVAIEVSTPDSAVANTVACLEAGCPVVLGTTGWYDERDDLEAAVERSGVGLLEAANFSVGVALLRVLSAQAGRWLADAPGFDVALVETHHTRKRDAPSGTARLLADTVEEESGREVPITSIRTGHVPGTHVLTIDGPYERITLGHEARDRRVFADGALTAAAWLKGRSGWHTMEDMLQHVVSTEGRG